MCVCVCVCVCVPFLFLVSHLLPIRRANQCPVDMIPIPTIATLPVPYVIAEEYLPLVVANGCLSVYACETFETKCARALCVKYAVSL